MITFKVDDVKLPRSPPEVDKYVTQKQFLKQGLAVAGIRGDSVEAHKFNAADVEFYGAQQNSFVHAAMTAYSGHYSFAIAPDDLWLVVAQAVTKHIELNPEECRKALVSWEGKRVIQVTNDDFHKGSPDNNWEREFGKFGDELEHNIGKKRDMFDPTFTTTTPTEKAAIQVQMMAALAPYCEYRMMTLCGVPTITLLGEPQDWFEIAKRADAFAEFYPQWAHKPLMTAVGHFVQAAAGKPDLSFWQNFFKISGGSGGTHINGWINAFFPYTNNKPNKMMHDAEFERVIEKGPRSGPEIGDYTPSIAVVPMHWNCRGAQYDMGLATGIFGSTLVDVAWGGETIRAYKPVVGWAVWEAKRTK